VEGAGGFGARGPAAAREPRPAAARGAQALARARGPLPAVAPLVCLDVRGVACRGVLVAAARRADTGRLGCRRIRHPDGSSVHAVVLMRSGGLLLPGGWAARERRRTGWPCGDLGRHRTSLLREPDTDRAPERP